MQSFKEKENEKTGADCQISPFVISFLFLGKNGKDLPKQRGTKFFILNNGLRF